MVQTNHSWLFPHRSWQLPGISCMSTSLQPRQPECLPACLNQSSPMLSASMLTPGSLVPGTNHGSQVLPANIAMPGPAANSVFNTEPKYYPHELLQQLHPGFPTSLPSLGSYPNEQQFISANRHDGRATANLISGSLQKGLVIFDQTGNKTRLIYGSFRTPYQYAADSTTELASSLNVNERQLVKTDSLSPIPALQEEYDENHLGLEESEMHEDTEELNALLYSDEEDGDDDDDDDGVMSTGHSPIGIKRNHQNQDHAYDVTEQVVSSDGPNKKQKLLNGGDDLSVMVDAGYSVKLEGSHEYDSDAESSCAIGHNYKDETLHDEQSMKDKIRLTLKILESIIPGAKGKNPLLVFDESIDYLKSLKLETKPLGVNHC